jgi:hypothetical protein
VNVTANAADNVGVAGVRFFVDGTPIGAEDTSPPHAVSWDTRTATNGSHALTAVARDAAGNSTTSAAVTVAVTTGPEPVVWTSLVNVTATGNSLKKTSGCEGCPDAGGVSSQTIASGNGYVEFQAPETTTFRVAGLSNGNADTSREDIDFGISLGAGGGGSIRENGLYRAQLTYAAGDLFRVAVESGVVKYSKNGTVFYTSTLAPRYPLLLDTTFYSRNATIAQAVISRSASSSSTQ